MTNTTQASKIDDLAQLRVLRSAGSIRQQIRSTEASGDRMLEDSADLMKAMVAARREAAVAPHTGQRAIMRLAKAQQSIISAQNDIFRVHDELVGIQAVLMPDQPESTEPSGLADEEMEQMPKVAAVA